MRGRPKALLLVCALVTLAAGVLAARAGAFYDNGQDRVPGAFLVSADYQHLEQGDDTTRFAAISADGRYVAIETFARNFFAPDDPDPPGRYRGGGIFRFDLQTRSLEKVADGNLFDEATNSFVRRGANSPSISADGRYVAFATAQPLTAADTNENLDVYVRDMDLPLPPGGVCGAGPECPYELVSARDGGETPATYEAPSQPQVGGNPGAMVSRGVAISADGRRVAFRTEAPSDLPAQAGNETPAGQIFVRDLATETTTLVTARREEGPGGETMTSAPAGGSLGAAISADGTAVAWTGFDAPEQTRFVRGENLDPSFYYYLWRRAPFGPQQATRRITGISDPDNQACRQAEEANPSMVTPFDSTSQGPCYGPLTDQEGFRSDISGQLPVLSADGYTVAFTTGAGPRPINSTGPGLDLFVTKMNPGLDRKEATTELTRDTASFETAVSAPISSIAISPEGRYIGFTTSRTKFSLPVLHMVGEPRAVAGPHELYLVDLAEHSIERAAHSISSGDIDGEVLDGVSLSSGAQRIAFTSFAGNLYYGDSNQRTDAFVVSREVESEAGGNGQKPPAGTSTIQDLGGPHISARVQSVKGGVAILLVSVPEAGTLRAVATSRATGTRQTVARARGRAPAKGRVKVTLRLGHRFTALMRREGSLEARARVSFTPLTPGKHLSASVKIVYSAG